MVTLDYKLMLSLSLWQYNHHPDEGLTSGLFQKTFGPVDGKHYYEKWTGYFNQNLWDMIAYFRGEGENGQKFCDMIAAQVELYTKNRENAKIKKNRHIEAGNVVLFSYTANQFNLHIFLEIENKTIYGRYYSKKLFYLLTANNSASTVQCSPSVRTKRCQ